MAEFKGKLKKLVLGEIRPEGWLKRELELEAKGVFGRLDEVFDDVSDKSAWLGGHGEAWENGPYYLDGLISLAYLLRDERLTERVNKWVEKMLASVDANGFFGPSKNDDWWPRIAALRALSSYYDATGDKQIPSFFRNFFKYEFNNLDDSPFYKWAAARSFEQFVPMKSLYDETGDEMINQLVDKIVNASYDWFTVYEKFRFRKPAANYLNRRSVLLRERRDAKADRKIRYGNSPSEKKKSAAAITLKNKSASVRKPMLMNGVNNAMAVKYPVLLNDFRPDPELVNLTKKTVENLLKYHGTAVGMFTSDKMLDGNLPTKGIDACAVVEFMRSLEILMEKTGDPYYADLLELNCFNTLPAMITPDFTACQSVQQVNSVSTGRVKRDFFNVPDDATVFGLNEDMGYCAADIGTGFAKFAEYLCFKSDEGFCFMTYSPCRIETTVDGVKVIMRETTDYPFKNTAKITIESVSGNPEVKFSFRVPAETNLEIRVNGKKIVSGDKGFIAFSKKITAGDTFELLFDMPLVTVTNPDKTVSFRKGPLVLATALRTKTSKKGRGVFCNYEYKAISQWRTVPELHRKKLAVLAERENDLSETPFDDVKPPLEIDYRARYAENWYEVKNCAGAAPRRVRCGKDAFTRTLVPYGCTRGVRITHQPVYKG